MSILFPQVREPRGWDFRPRYYDPEKERRKELLEKRRLERAKETGEKDDENSRTERKREEHYTTLHRGSFREAHEANFQMKDKARSKSRIAFWLALLVMLVFCFYWLM